MSANEKQKWLIVSKDYHKAFDIFKQIEKEQTEQENFLLANNGVDLYFKNELEVVWIMPSDNFRSLRFHRLWCDKDIDQDYLEQIILPMAVYMNYEDIIWI